MALASSAWAQSDAAQTPSNDTIKQLMDRLTAAEAKIQQLQTQLAGQGAAPAPVAPATPAPVPAVAAAPAEAPPANEAPPMSMSESPSAGMDHMMEIPGGPVLHIRGFFDVDFDKGPVAQQLAFPLGTPGYSAFRGGEFDLFMTSQLSDKLSFITEFVMSAGPNNAYGIDLERYQLTYRQSKYFEISGGRYHTAIGYYNTAFHHGNWFSTATGRPFMYYFEDAGGVLPVHELGVTTTGFIPGTGKMNVHWTAEIGNGLPSFGSAYYGDGVQNYTTDRNHKDVNFAVYSRPEWAPGLQFGGSYLTGDMAPFNGFPKVNQQVSSAYAVFINPKWEFMNEAVLMQHQITNGGRSFNSPMGYTQLAYHVGKYRPYFRWQEVNIPSDDPVAQYKGRYEGPSAGIRWDPFDYAALKLQYNRVFQRNLAAQNGLELQMAFTF